MAAIFKSSLQNLSPLPTSLKVEPLTEPKTSLKFFVNTTEPKTKVLAVFVQKLETKDFNLLPIIAFIVSINSEMYRACKVRIHKKGLVSS